MAISKHLPDCPHLLADMDRYAMTHNCPICIIASATELATLLLNKENTWDKSFRTMIETKCQELLENIP